MQPRAAYKSQWAASDQNNCEARVELNLSDNSSMRISSQLDKVLSELFQKKSVAREGDLVTLVLKASAAIARRSGETSSGWYERLSRRFGELPDIEFALGAFAASDTCVQEMLSELSAKGIWGLNCVVDELSLDPRTDIPSTFPNLAFPVWAGISNIPVSISLSSGLRLTNGSVDLLVHLPHDQRGAHMSRLQSAIESNDGKDYADIVEYSLKLVQQVLREQPALAARSTISVTLKHPIRSAVTGTASSIVSRVSFDLVSRNEGLEEAKIKFTVGVMTACPCTLMYSGLRAAKELGLPSHLDLLPTFTHSQPGELELCVEGALSEIPSLQVFLALCADVATLREAILKRPDEHYLVESSHRRPQFTEDLTRAAASALAARLSYGVAFAVEARLDESIHPHKAVSRISGRSDQFWSNGHELDGD
jgi:GTP cyclohydrolase FolE2